MPNTRGAAIVGAGVIYRDHARAYTHLADRVRMIGLADVDAARARTATQQFSIGLSAADYRELLAREDVDLVSICTPPNLHEEMVCAALEAGKYVLCEKPLAHTLAACDRVIETANRHPGRLSAVYQLRYSPEAQRTVWILRKVGRGSAASGPSKHTAYVQAVLDAMDAPEPLPIGPDDARRSVEL